MAMIVFNNSACRIGLDKLAAIPSSRRRSPSLVWFAELSMMSVAELSAGRRLISAASV
jgi:hypothetical protein